MSINREEFRAALGRFASGVTVVTTKDSDGNFFGITVSAFSSVSIEPPLILVCIDRKAGSHHAFQETKTFIVNILHENQQAISNQFASKLEDKFAGIEYTHGIENIPILQGALVNLECRLKDTFESGDHTIFVGEIENAIINEGNPLVYFNGSYRKI